MRLRRRLVLIGVVALLALAGAPVHRAGPGLPTQVAGTVLDRRPVAELPLPVELPAAALAAAQPLDAPAPAPAEGEVAVTPAPLDFDAPAEPSAPPPQKLERPAPAAKGGGTWAVVIGVNDYPGSRYDLRSAVADAGDVDAALALHGVPAANRLVLTDRQASAATIRRAAAWLVERAGPDAVAVLFFAGHIRRMGGGTEAIVGADGGLVRDHELAHLLAPLEARRVWVALAACYSGGFTEVLAPGRVLTAASPAHQLAYENEAYGRSYLVEYLVRRGWLQGGAGDTVEEAFAFAEAELRRDHPNRVPVQFDQHDGNLDLRPPGASRPSGAASPSGSSGGSGSGSGGSQAPPPSSPPPSSPPPSSPPTTDRCSEVTFGFVSCGS